MPEVKRLDLTLQVCPTDTLAALDGVPCRAWQGVDEDEGQYLLFVLRIMPLDDKANAKLASLLLETIPPVVADVERYEGGVMTRKKIDRAEAYGRIDSFTKAYPPGAKWLTSAELIDWLEGIATRREGVPADVKKAAAELAKAIPALGIVKWEV
jgi:uncharacterized protein YggU (UPF0235/DUF167 family)